MKSKTLRTLSFFLVGAIFFMMGFFAKEWKENKEVTNLLNKGMYMSSITNIRNYVYAIDNIQAGNGADVVDSYKYLVETELSVLDSFGSELDPYLSEEDKELVLKAKKIISAYER